MRERSTERERREGEIDKRRKRKRRRKRTMGRRKRAMERKEPRKDVVGSFPRAVILYLLSVKTIQHPTDFE